MKKLNKVSKVILVFGIGFVIIMLFISAEDIYKYNSYSNLRRDLNKIDSEYIGKYNKFKKNPQLSSIDFNDPAVNKKWADLKNGIDYLDNIGTIPTKKRMNRKINILVIGSVLFIASIISSQILLKNEWKTINSCLDDRGLFMYIYFL